MVAGDSGRNAICDLRCYRAIAAPARTKRGRSEMTPHLDKDGAPSVVHVIPSPRGRGAQRVARVLVDRLNDLGGMRHFLLGLFEGPPEVELDLEVGHPAGKRPAEGFDPRLALELRRVLGKVDPAAIVAHGGDAMKYALPAVVGTRRPLAYCVIGTYAGPPTLLHEWMWRRIMAPAELVVAVGDEVLDECIGRFRVLPRRAVVIPNGRDPSRFRPRSGPAEAADDTLIFVGALDTAEATRSVCRGRASPEGRGTRRTRPYGRRRAAGGDTRPCGGGPWRRAPRSTRRRTRTPPPFGRVRVHQPAHR